LYPHPLHPLSLVSPSFFFFHAPTTSPTYPLSLHDALPIYRGTILRIGRTYSMGSPRYAVSSVFRKGKSRGHPPCACQWEHRQAADRKSTRLNSSHVSISYAVFCLKKKKK